ncbi:MAG TPA: patatin-like phospholipase family protein [Galbitalea sp.]|jgi:NTE family protein
MNTNSSPASSSSSERALVLHGGGAAGNAWEIGVIAGFLNGGLDVTTADLIVGTSAGATAAAQITSASPADLYASILDAPMPSRPGDGPANVRAQVQPPIDFLQRSTRVIESSSDAADMRRRMGASALELDDQSDDAPQTRWRDTVAARITSHDWPAQRILITAVDAHTGEGIAFDRESGVDLVDAIAASTSSGLPYRIGEKRYIDGGYRRNENVDLASGYSRVLVLSPFGGRTRHPLEWGMQLAAQIVELEADGSRVETVFPDEDALAAFGGNMMNLAARPAAARAGYEHGKRIAAPLKRFWE